MLARSPIARPCIDAGLAHYVIVRDDVPTGVQAAMVIHAAGSSAQLPGAGSAAPPTVAVALIASPDELHEILP